MDKDKSNWKIGLLPLYALIILLAASFMYSYADTDADRVFLSPTLKDSNGWDIYSLNDGVKKEVSTPELFDSSGETIYLSRILDKQLENDGYTILELDGISWQESVFLEGDLLYTVNPSLDNRIGFVEFPKEYKGLQGMGEYTRLSLPPGYGGKTLTIAMAFNTAMDYHSLPMIRLSSESIQTQLFVSDTNRISIPATIYLSATLLLLGLFFYNLYHGRKSFSILLLMLAALLQALRLLLNFEFMFSSHFTMDFIPSELLIPLAYGLPLLYLLTQMKRWRKWYAPFLLVPLILSVALHIMGRLPMFAAISSYQYDSILYVPLLALGAFAALEWNDRNTVYRLFTPMFFIIVAGIALADLSFTLAGKTPVLVKIFYDPLNLLPQTLQYCGSILLLLTGGISFFMSIKRIANTQSELSVMAARNELIKENIQSIQESSTKIAIMRHDMLRHLHIMLDLSHEGQKERLERYLEDLTTKTEDILPVRVCQHPIVNALVTRALAKAKEAHIQMDLHVEVPADIPIADSDLCTLVTNMLDNAIEAVASLPEEKRQAIELTIHVRGSYLFIETINTYSESTALMDKKTGLFKSTKGTGHGYGMKAMSDIAKKYMSKLQIKHEQNTVIVRTALLIPEKSK